MRYIVIVIIFGVLPIQVSASVFINEIAWMGTLANANAEWIELYNDGDEQDISGWKLIAIDGSPVISLAGSIGSHSYFLLERSSDSTLPNTTADLIYTGALGNDGEYLQLQDAVGTTIDEVTEWFAGDNSTKETMQLVDDRWITAAATPRAPNATEGIQPSSGSENIETFEDVPQPQIKDSVFLDLVPFETAGVPVVFEAKVNFENERDVRRGKFQWSFGDGGIIESPKNISVSHVFYYPGEYQVVFSFYETLLQQEPDLIQKQKIVIVSHALEIMGYTDDGGVIIKNTSEKEIDLFGWQLASSSKSYTFPKYTLVPKGKSLTLAPQIIGFAPSEINERLFLKNSLGKIITSFQPEKTALLQEILPEQEIVIPVEPQIEVIQENIPEKKTIFNIWNEYQWYIIAGGTVFLILLAYFLIDLYATRDTLATLADEDN